MEIVMPKLGLTMTEGKLIRWRKAEGGVVKQGEILFEFESEKASLEFESPSDGVLIQILVHEGETVPCGTPVAVLETTVALEQTPTGRDMPRSAQVMESGSGAMPSRHAVEGEQMATSRPFLATPAAKRRAREMGVALTAMAGRGPQGRIHVADVEASVPVQIEATPIARRLASELGVDLKQVSGSGLGRRISKEDVLRAGSEKVQEASASVGQKIPLTGIRGVIARRMSESAFTAPHVTLFTEADATALVEARAQLNAELAPEVKISYNTLLIAIVARALREHPRLNACVVGEEIRLYDDVHVALAVDTEWGLLAPVIRHADRLDLVSIQRISDELLQRALAGKGLPDDLAGGTFTITNLGMFDVDGFTPIINQPQAAILGVGRIASKPVALGNEVTIRQVVTLSLSFDHRIVDGGPAGRFLQRVRQLVERPFALAVPLR
jgi:pyruvate dehydrogenase E2 component (dihydrolipoamide acetyltransferase)